MSDGLVGDQEAVVAHVNDGPCSAVVACRQNLTPDDRFGGIPLVRDLGSHRSPLPSTTQRADTYEHLATPLAPPRLELQAQLAGDFPRVRAGRNFDCLFRRIADASKGAPQAPTLPCPPSDLQRAGDGYLRPVVGRACGMTGAGIARPRAMVFDVIGTLFDLEPVRQRFVDLGAAPPALEGLVSAGIA